MERFSFRLPGETIQPRYSQHKNSAKELVPEIPVGTGVPFGLPSALHNKRGTNSEKDRAQPTWLLQRPLCKKFNFVWLQYEKNKNLDFNQTVQV